MNNWLWLIGLLLISPLAQATTIKTMPLLPVKGSQTMIKKICATLQPQCQDENVNLWKVKGSQDHTVYLIDDNLPRLVKLTKQTLPQGEVLYQPVTEWNFSHYQHSDESTDTKDDMYPQDHLTIYPALYPMNANQFAVAVIKQWNTSYSGGGAGRGVADFVMLKEDGYFQTAFKSIPFSESSMIRACFSEQEYLKSPHCHDEEWMILRLAFKDVGQPYYQWQFTYQTSHWDAFKSKKTTKVTTTKETLMPFTQ